MLPLLGVLCPSLERLVESYISYLHGRFFAPVHSVGEPVVFFFFFSSRRRHTRCLSDWSSDVCSSDLCERPRRQVEPRSTAVQATQWSEVPLAGEGVHTASVKIDGQPLTIMLRKVIG